MKKLLALLLALLLLPLSESRTQGILTDGVRRYFEARAKEAAAAQAAPTE